MLMMMWVRSSRTQMMTRKIMRHKVTYNIKVHGQGGASKCLDVLRASTIELSQLSIFLLSWRKEKRREKGKRALREEPALARAPRYFVRMKGGPHNKKVVHSFDLLLYMLTIRWVVDDMALAYSQQLAILLTMLFR